MQGIRLRQSSHHTCGCRPKSKIAAIESLCAEIHAVGYRTYENFPWRAAIHRCGYHPDHADRRDTEHFTLTARTVAIGENPPVRSGLNFFRSRFDGLFVLRVGIDRGFFLCLSRSARSLFLRLLPFTFLSFKTVVGFSWHASLQSGRQAKRAARRPPRYFLVFSDQVFCSHLAVAARYQVERYLLTFIQPGKAGTLDRADMHERVLGTVFRFDEPKTLGGVEPLHCTFRHFLSFRDISRAPPNADYS